MRSSLLDRMALVDIVDIAKVCHEANRAYCMNIGDSSQRTWAMTPPDIKQSAIDAVKFHIENQEANDWDSHNNWSIGKALDGWIYGEVKCLIAKTHPCLVPFRLLPPEQQLKDRLFRMIVKVFVEGLSNA